MRDLIEEFKSTDDIHGFIMEHRRELLKYAVLAVGIMTALLLFAYRGGDDLQLTDTARTVTAEDQIVDADGEGADQSGEGASLSPAGNGSLYVDIGGAVKSPKLAELPSGSRVEDAIQEAGGLTQKADISTINRAELLTDGQKIYIPEMGEITEGVSGAGGSLSGASSASASSGGSGTVSGKVNINTADITQLQTLTGVGPVTAQKILDYRTQNGRFTAIEDLKNVSGIGDKTFEKMKDQVTV